MFMQNLDFGRKDLHPHPRPRIGKTAKDKENGHVAYRKNRRVWRSSTSSAGIGEWVKA